MAIKSTPNLPTASRLVAPIGGGPQIKNALKTNTTGSTTKRVMAGAKGKGMKGC